MTARKSLLFAWSICLLPFFFCHEPKLPGDFNLSNTRNHHKSLRDYVSGISELCLWAAVIGFWTSNIKPVGRYEALNAGLPCTLSWAGQGGDSAKGQVRAHPCPAARTARGTLCTASLAAGTFLPVSWRAGTAGTEVFACVQDVSSRSTQVSYSPVSSEESLCTEPQLLPTPVDHWQNFQQEL